MFHVFATRCLGPRRLLYPVHLCGPTGLSAPTPSFHVQYLCPYTSIPQQEKAVSTTRSPPQQTASEVRESLASLGVHLHQEWIAHCLGDDSNNVTNSSSSNGYRRMSTEQAKEKVYQTFLSCDLREAGTGCIPAGVGNMAKERIQGKIVVQASIYRSRAACCAVLRLYNQKKTKKVEKNGKWQSNKAPPRLKL